jgi:adenylate cyclase
VRVERCFGFVDLSGFTEFTERYGDEHTVVMLARFRTMLREVAARRGVRITKWLGDGAMLSSPDTEATVALVLEIAAHPDPSAVPLEIRSGLARGPVIMFEGDDYIGRAPNVASRLCDAAMPGQVLATREVASLAPRWVAASEAFPYQAAGFNQPLHAVRLGIGASEVMVRDPHCGLVVPDVIGLITRWDDDGTAIRFCSGACALAWEQQQRLAKLDAIPAVAARQGGVEEGADTGQPAGYIRP